MKFAFFERIGHFSCGVNRRAESLNTSGWWQKTNHLMTGQKKQQAPIFSDAFMNIGKKRHQISRYAPNNLPNCMFCFFRKNTMTWNVNRKLSSAALIATVCLFQTKDGWDPETLCQTQPSLQDNPNKTRWLWSHTFSHCAARKFTTQNHEGTTAQKNFNSQTSALHGPN